MSRQVVCWGGDHRWPPWSSGVPVRRSTGGSGGRCRLSVSHGELNDTPGE